MQNKDNEMIEAEETKMNFCFIKSERGNDIILFGLNGFYANAIGKYLTSVLAINVNPELPYYKTIWESLPFSTPFSPKRVGIIHGLSIQKFIEALFTLKKEYGSKLNFSETFNVLMSALSDNKYEIPVDLTIWKRRELALRNRDFNEAISLAQFYMSNYKKDSISPTVDTAIEWLINAAEFSPGYIELQKAINRHDFFHSITFLGFSPIFAKNAKPILDLLKSKDTINTIGFRDPMYSKRFDLDYINEYFGDFIAETKTIKYLFLYGSDSSPDYRLKIENIRHIAHGLKLNSSIEEIALSNLSIDDEGLEILLTALVSNPNTRVKKLDLSSNDITDKGKEILQDFLKSNKIDVDITNNPKPVATARVTQDFSRFADYHMNGIPVFVLHPSSPLRNNVADSNHEHELEIENGNATKMNSELKN